jgi:hypothetical protein
VTSRAHKDTGLTPAEILDITCPPAQVTGRYAGPSIVQMMERHLDATRRLDTPLDDAKAIGIVEAIAIIRDPYAFLGDPHRSWGVAVNNVWVASDERLERAQV